MDRKRIVAKRKNRIQFMLNDDEMKAFTRFCNDYGIKNRSAYIRESIFVKLIKKLENDYPTLFGADEMDRMIVKK